MIYRLYRCCLGFFEIIVIALLQKGLSCPLLIVVVGLQFACINGYTFCCAFLFVYQLFILCLRLSMFCVETNYNKNIAEAQ